MLLTEALAIRLTFLAIALFGWLTSIEYLYALARDEMGDRSLFTWEVCGCRKGWWFRGLPARFSAWCFQPTTFAFLLFLRIIGGVALVTLTDRTWLLVVSIFLSLLTNSLTIRHGHGRDGADQMILILLIGVTAYLCFAPSSPWRWVGIAFIATQSVLAYFISGAAKLAGREWRQGSALLNVFATTLYGSPRMAAILGGSSTIRVGMAWGLMAWEVSSPAILIMPLPYQLLWLAIGASFHGASAILMGLNTFFIAFIGTYPALLLTATLIQSAIKW